MRRLSLKGVKDNEIVYSHGRMEKVDFDDFWAKCNASGGFVFKATCFILSSPLLLLLANLLLGAFLRTLMSCLCAFHLHMSVNAESMDRWAFD